MTSLLTLAAATAPLQTARADEQIDRAVWGAYADLAGKTWTGERDGTNWRIHTEWKVLDQELTETWINADRDTHGLITGDRLVRTITRGDEPGELRVKTNTGCLSWTGKVQEDGAVLFQCDGLIKMPYVVHAPEPGVMEQQPVRISRGEITRIKQPLRYRLAAAGETAAVASRASDFAFPRFPDIADAPEIPYLRNVRELYRELTSPDWTPQVRAQASGGALAADGSPIEGEYGISFFCSAGFGPGEIRYTPTPGAKRNYVVTRVRASCENAGNSGIVPGMYLYDDGSMWIGSMRYVRGRALPAAIGPGALFREDGSVAFGEVNEHRALRVDAFAYSDGNLFVAAAPGASIQSPTRVAARIYIGRAGAVEGFAQAGRFSLPENPVYVANDESFRATGQFVARFPDASNPSSLIHSGVTRYVTSKDTALGPPGAYLSSDAQAVGMLPDPERVMPEPATLARYAHLAAECGVRPAVHVSWLLWNPTCSTETVYAWSPDGRYRLRVSDGAMTLQEFGAGAPGRPIAEWRAAVFTPDSVPAPVGEAEMWQDGVLAFRGQFDGVAPAGVGVCGRPASEGGGLENCIYEGGQRVDGVHLAREAQRRLEAEREARRLAAEQERLRQQRLAEEQRARQLAQQRAEEARASQARAGLMGALIGATVGAYGAAEAGMNAEQTAALMMKGAQAASPGTPYSAALGSMGDEMWAASSGGSPAAPAGGAAAGGASYPTKPNLALGACPGFTEANYRTRALEGGGDSQLYTMCGQAFEYYTMYKRAIAQGYSEADANRTYAAHEQSARVAIGYRSSHGAN